MGGGTSVVPLDSHKGILTHMWLLKWMFPWRHEGWHLLFHSIHWATPARVPSYLLQCINALDYFASPGQWDLSAVLLDSHKFYDILAPKWLLKQVFPWRHEGWHLLYHCLVHINPGRWLFHVKTHMEKDTAFHSEISFSRVSNKTRNRMKVMAKSAFNGSDTTASWCTLLRDWRAKLSVKSHGVFSTMTFQC